MSDTPQGPDWWLASDGKWYPGHLAPGAPPPPPPPQSQWGPPPQAGGQSQPSAPLSSPPNGPPNAPGRNPWRRFRRFPLAGQIAAWVVAVFVVLAVIGAAVGSKPSKPSRAAASITPSTTARTVPETTSTTSTTLPQPTTTAPPPPTTVPSYNGMNLATAVSQARSAGRSPSYVGGGLLGIIVTSDWTVCFSSANGNSVTFYASKDCNPDSNSKSGREAPTRTVGGLTGEDLQYAESKLSAAGYGYNEIGGGDLGIIVPSDWTVCYATNSGGSTDLYAAKDCTPDTAS